MKRALLTISLILCSARAGLASETQSPTRQLFDAIRDRDAFSSEEAIIEALTRAKRAGGDLNARDDRGLTPLLWACDRRLPKVTEWLATHGADVNQATPVNTREKQGGVPPLFLAVQNQPLPTIQVLIGQGAKVGAKTVDGYSVLFSALRFHRYDVAKYLLDKGAPLEGRKRIFLQAHIGDRQGVIKGWRRHTSPKLRNPEGESLLHVAVFHGHYALAKELLDRKCDVNAKDAEGHTPLWFAVQSEENPAGRPAMFELLASRGGDLQARFEKGRTLLHVAARVGTYRTDIRLFVDGVRWLLDKGLSPKARDQEGGTPAFVAAKAHNYPVAKLLVDSASDWDPDELGKIAIEALDNEAWLRELIERKKANINVRDGFGRTLLHKAAIKNSVKLARYLLDHGADPSVRNGFGETWLEEDAAGESFRQAFPPAPPKP